VFAIAQHHAGLCARAADVLVVAWRPFQAGELEPVAPRHLAGGIDLRQRAADDFAGVWIGCEVGARHLRRNSKPM